MARTLGESLEILLRCRVVRDNLQNLAWFDLVDILPCLEQWLGAIQSQTVERTGGFDSLFHTQHI